MQIDRGNVFVSAFAPSTMKRRQWLDEAATNEMIKGKRPPHSCRQLRLLVNEDKILRRDLPLGQRRHRTRDCSMNTVWLSDQLWRRFNAA